MESHGRQSGKDKLINYTQNILTLIVSSSFSET